jgi:hypothetical protein
MVKGRKKKEPGDEKNKESGARSQESGEKRKFA